MDAYNSYLNTLVNKTKSAYNSKGNLKWINSYTAIEAQKKRDRLIETIGDSVLFKGTKPYYKQLSKGCMLCGLGMWSCLFITGKCNASCFYCPSQQKQDEIPGSQSLSFPTAASYAEYINFFNFKGVSFSGGEPLLVPERVIDYLKQIRKKCSPEVYVWMYTNGRLANESIFKKLASLGLDEVRFDIGANAYNLDKINYAKGIIKNISVEIPVVPEEKECLKKLLPDMVKAGVSNLNLHQLRLTEYNAPKLLKRNYTYIAAEKPIVLESELAALEIIEYANKHHIEIGINYCSFFFKNRFQQSGFRKQIACKLAHEDDEITQKGYIRKINKESLSYYSMRIADSEKLAENAKILELKNKKYQFNTELLHKQLISDEIEYQQFSTFIAKQPISIPTESDLFKLWNYEYIEKDLREY